MLGQSTNVSKPEIFLISFECKSKTSNFFKRVKFEMAPRRFLPAISRVPNRMPKLLAIILREIKTMLPKLLGTILLEIKNMMLKLLAKTPLVRKTTRNVTPTHLVKLRQTFCSRRRSPKRMRRIGKPMPTIRVGPLTPKIKIIIKERKSTQANSVCPECGSTKQKGNTQCTRCHCALKREAVEVRKKNLLHLGILVVSGSTGIDTGTHKSGLHRIYESCRY